MGFPGYFLIVADFIQLGQEANGVPVGPGGVRAPARWWPIRSTSPTSTRCLRPAVRALPQPERVSMPDFDIDFARTTATGDRVRARALRQGRVSQIATFGTMASKAVVRDVGRVLDPAPWPVRLPLQADPGGAEHPLSSSGNAREQEPQINELMNDGNDGESIQDLWSLAEPLEGLTRQRRHARRRRADRARQASPTSARSTSPTARTPPRCPSSTRTTWRRWAW